MTVSHNAPAYIPTSWTLEFDGHPPGPNEKRRMNRYALAKVIAQWKEAGYVRARMAGIPKCQRVRLTGVVIRPRIGTADQSNDAGRFKEIEDGLVKAEVVPKDTYAHVEWAPVSQERGAKGVRLIVEMLR